MGGGKVIVAELMPGMQFQMRMPGREGTATFIQKCPHPLYAGLEMVIWWLGDRWSHDALSAQQDVGEPIGAHTAYRYQYRENLKAAFQEARDVAEAQRSTT